MGMDRDVRGERQLGVVVIKCRKIDACAIRLRMVFNKCRIEIVARP